MQRSACSSNLRLSSHSLKPGDQSKCPRVPSSCVYSRKHLLSRFRRPCISTISSQLCGAPSNLDMFFPYRSISSLAPHRGRRMSRDVSRSRATPRIPARAPRRPSRCVQLRVRPVRTTLLTKNSFSGRLTISGNSEDTAPGMPASHAWGGHDPPISEHQQGSLLSEALKHLGWRFRTTGPGCCRVLMTLIVIAINITSSAATETTSHFHRNLDGLQIPAREVGCLHLRGGQEELEQDGPPAVIFRAEWNGVGQVRPQSDPVCRAFREVPNR